MSKIEELEKKLGELQAELNELKAKSVVDVEWPRNGDNYWFFYEDTDCGSEDAWEQDSITDKRRLATGNVHHSEAEAIRYGERLKAEAAIRRKIGSDLGGPYYPYLADREDPSPSYTMIKCNPFGCKIVGKALIVAEMPEFKTWLGVE